MKKSDFWYNLPEELIAQHPLEQRDSSRLLHMDRQTGSLEHSTFTHILDYLRPDDCLIINDTRVLPCRIYGVKETGAVVEFLLLNQIEMDTWECLAGPGKKARPGAQFVFGDGLLKATVEDVKEDGNRVVRFHYDGNNFFAILDQIGQMPLPPYIKEKLKDQERYQTVYSREIGSAAAPTAGLHFTPELLKKVEDMGVRIGRVTLHVGLGTFRPVKEEEITDHKMHSEHYWMPKETADLINQTKKKGGRVICVGTTSCRTVESVAQKNGCICEDEDWTSIFIYPGYQFQCMDGLITNFHLPESTLIMLVSAFAGYEHTMSAYEEAVKEHYRFFSFGDAMFIS